MNIVGKGNNVVDADLLGRLAVSHSSGNTVSKKELESAIRSIKSGLTDEFSHSTRGLSRAELAVANTLNLAVKSGWVKAGTSAKLVKEFLEGDAANSLKGIGENIRKAVRENQSPSRGSSYGGYSSSRTSTRTSYGS